MTVSVTPQPCDWLTRAATILQVSCDCVAETLARLKQEGQWRSTQYVGKTAYLLLPCSALKDFSWLALHSDVQNKIVTTYTS